MQFTWSCGLLVFWSFGRELPMLTAVTIWSDDFNRRSSSLFSTWANKFAPPGGSSIARALLHSISILIIHLCDLRDLCEMQFTWSCGLLVFWSFGRELPMLTAVTIWSDDFNRRSSSLFSTWANKFAPPVGSSIARALLRSITILINSAISATSARGHSLRSLWKKNLPQQNKPPPLPFFPYQLQILPRNTSGLFSIRTHFLLDIVGIKIGLPALGYGRLSTDAPIALRTMRPDKTDWVFDEILVQTYSFTKLYDLADRPPCPGK